MMIDTLNKTILVVDDDDVNRLITSTMLTQMGANAFVAKSGEEAVKLVEENAFDLILMDLEMPDMDGTQTTRNIRSKGHTMPVMAMSAYNSFSGHSRAQQAGIRVFIRKPIDTDKLSEVLDLLDDEASMEAGMPALSV
jgi:CheY-like chemotaxis protein